MIKFSKKRQITSKAISIQTNSDFCSGTINIGAKKNFFPEFQKPYSNNNIKKNIVKLKIYLFKLLNIFIK